MHAFAMDSSNFRLFSPESTPFFPGQRFLEQRSPRSSKRSPSPRYRKCKTSMIFVLEVGRSSWPRRRGVTRGSGRRGSTGPRAAAARRGRPTRRPAGSRRSSPSPRAQIQKRIYPKTYIQQHRILNKLQISWASWSLNVLLNS